MISGFGRTANLFIVDKQLHEKTTSMMNKGFPRVRGNNLLFSNIFAENCMKMKEIGARGGRGMLHEYLMSPIPLDLPVQLVKMFLGYIY